MLLREKGSQFLVNGQRRLRFVKFSPQAGLEVEVKANAIPVGSDFWVVENSGKKTIGGVILGKESLRIGAREMEMGLSLHILWKYLLLKRQRCIRMDNNWIEGRSS